jgi:hypothetical protein
MRSTDRIHVLLYPIPTRKSTSFVTPVLESDDCNIWVSNHHLQEAGQLIGMVKDHRRATYIQ